MSEHPQDGPGTSGARTTSPLRWLGLVVAVAALTLVAVGLVHVRGARDSRDAGPLGHRLPWLSGATTPQSRATDHDFADWRGRPLDITGTWNDTFEAQTQQQTLTRGGYADGWNGPLDDAIGAIWKDRGETWSAAAQGAYDDRWRSALITLRDAWKDRDGTLYIRFAHEFNGDWYPWNVTADETEDFKAAWRRFRALQRDIFPQSKLVFAPNFESADSMGTDWRQAFPGAEYVDVLAVDYYNQSQFISTPGQFDQQLDSVDKWGGPRGLEAHRLFAQSQGLPFAVPEWSTDATRGDSPAFISGFYSWLTSHAAGTGPGQVLYEIQFGVHVHEDAFALFQSHRQPLASAEYRKLWAAPRG